MTKKDYELIASSLNYCKPSKIARPQGFEDRFFTWKGIVYDMTMNLASKNPRFQKEKFLQACGVEVEQKCACDGCNNIAEQYYKKEKYCDGHYCMIHSTQ